MLDVLIFRIASVGSRQRRAGIAVLAAPGDGNIGDHAMMQAFLHGVVSDRNVVISELAGKYDYLSEKGVEVVVLPSVLNGRGPRCLVAVWRLARIARGLHAFCVVGADMMDGGYGRLSAVRRWSLARACASSGVDSRILGFSWNGRPDKAALELARLACASGVRCFVRDPLSASRARSSGLGDVVECRDIVFAHHFHQGPGAPASTRKAVVNASGLIGRHLDQTEGYAAIVEYLRANGIRVVLLPHVIHRGSDDNAAIAMISSRFEGDTGVEVIEHELSPSQVAAIVTDADIVITGRMHLSILALSQGCPAIVLSTQGKVEGLLNAMGLPEGCVEPVPGFEGPVMVAADTLLRGGEVLRQQIRDAAAEARKLAVRNFEGLGRV